MNAIVNPPKSSGFGDLRWRNTAHAVPVWVFLITLAIYLVCPTQNYYWDGISFAQAIEDFSGTDPVRLLHPNHLIYNVVGAICYRFLLALGLDTRALTVLQAINSIVAALTAVVMFSLLRRISHSVYLAICGAILLALSATWWRYATDADSYILAAFLLTCCFNSLLRDRPNPLAAASFHLGAMLIHQLAVIFGPVVVAGLLMTEHRPRKKLQALGWYLGIAGVGISYAYVHAYSLLHGKFDTAGFLAWLTSHSDDSAFTFALFPNIARTLQSYGRLFTGGRPSLLLREGFDPVIVAAAIATVLLIVLLMRALMTAQPEPGSRPAPSSLVDRAQTLAWLWIGCYAVFLFFWLPQNTFYKIFSLPALIIAASIAVSKARWANHRAIVLSVLTLASVNFLLAIYPYSRTSSNETVRFSKSIGGNWPAGSIVLFSSFTPDNWYLRYFNPQTSWQRIPDQPRDFEALLERAGTAHQSVFLETTATDLITQRNYPLSEGACMVVSPLKQIIDRGHRIIVSTVKSRRC